MGTGSGTELTPEAALAEGAAARNAIATGASAAASCSETSPDPTGFRLLLAAPRRVASLAAGTDVDALAAHEVVVSVASLQVVVAPLSEQLIGAPLTLHHVPAGPSAYVVTATGRPDLVVAAEPEIHVHARATHERIPARSPYVRGR